MGCNGILQPVEAVAGSLATPGAPIDAMQRAACMAKITLAAAGGLDGSHSFDRPVSPAPNLIQFVRLR